MAGEELAPEDTTKIVDLLVTIDDAYVRMVGSADKLGMVDFRGWDSALLCSCLPPRDVRILDAGC